MFFSEDYYEHGIEKGLSLYQNYRWKPERSLKEAHWFVKHMDVSVYNDIIDFGCAKGFFVKAMRLLGYQCFGVDCSDYAVSHAENEVKDYVFNYISHEFDYGFCKDVLEHCVDHDNLMATIKNLYEMANQWLIIVPLGNGENYYYPFFDKDKSHFIKYDRDKWIDCFQDAGFHVKLFSKMNGIKDAYHYIDDANLFIKAVRHD